MESSDLNRRAAKLILEAQVQVVRFARLSIERRKIMDELRKQSSVESARLLRLLAVSAIP
jgi:hypothetical protein